jgi:hypothetical protein
MNGKQNVIPISRASSGCSAGAPAAAAGCASASSCSSASSCGAAQGDVNDPLFRLRQEGWVLRTTIGEPRLSEIAENYRAMGQEVHIEYFEVPQPASQDSACTTCFDTPGASQVWGSVYVRPGKPGQARNEELF